MQSPMPPTLSTSWKSADFEQVFNYIDEDGDGKISPAELRNCMRCMGEELYPEEAEEVIASTDSDGDGLLGFDDFLKLVEVESDEEKRRNMRAAFRAYEMEGHGCITPESLKRALGRLGETKTIDECTTMIRRFDVNGDGVVDFEEFINMML